MLTVTVSLFSTLCSLMTAKASKIRSCLSFSLFIVSLSWFVSGCTLHSAKPDNISATTNIFTSKNESALENFYQLQDIPEELQGKQFLELLTITRKEQHKLLTQIEFTQKMIKIAGMTPNGLPVIQVQWHQDKGLIDLKSQYFDEKMVMGIIRDIQLVKWPLEYIELGLIAGATMTERAETSIKSEDYSKIRSVNYNDQLIMSTVYSLNTVRVQNIVNGYEINLENLD